MNILDNMVTLNHNEYKNFFKQIKSKLGQSKNRADRTWETEINAQKTLKKQFGKKKVRITRKELF